MANCAFVGRRWQNLSHLPKASRGNKKLAEIAIRQEGLALQFASRRLQSDFDLVMKAVRQNGLALEFACPDLQDNKVVVTEAVKQNGRALEFASEAMRKDSEIVGMAALNDMCCLLYADQSLVDDDRLLLNVVNQSVTSLWDGGLEYGKLDPKNSSELIEQYMRDKYPDGVDPNLSYTKISHTSSGMLEHASISLS